MTDNRIAGILTVDYFKPSGKWYETVETEVTFEDLTGDWLFANDWCKLFTKKTGRAVPHPYFTSFMRLENQHTENQSFCRFLVHPLENEIHINE